MPITVRKFNAQVKDPETGDMVPAGLLSSDSIEAIEEAETAAVAAVEGKQAVAEAAVELKGQTTLASIPADYTELSNEVDDVKTQLNGISKNDYVDIPFTIAQTSKIINYTTGKVGTGNVYYGYTDFIDVSNFSIIKYKRTGTTSSYAATGMAFYSDNNENSYISGIISGTLQAEVGYMSELYETIVPENAKFARFTVFVPVETYGNFENKGASGIYKDITLLKNKVDYNEVYLGDKINTINDFVPTWESGYRAINGGNFDPFTVIPNPELVTALIPAKAGDVFYVTGKMWSGYNPVCNLFAAVRSDGTSGGLTPTGVDWYNHKYICPSNTAYVVINGKIGEKYDIYKLTRKDLEDELSTINSNISVTNENVANNSNAINGLTKKQAIFDPVAKPNIVLLGDSITRGVGSSDYSPTGGVIPCSADPAQQRNVGTTAWAAKFSALLGDHYGANVTNNGVSQYTTAKILTDINTLCPDGTDVAILTVGTNDRGAGYSTLNTNVRNLINAILAKNVQLFVFSPIPLNTTATLGMQKINNIFKAACSDLAVPFFSLFSEFEAFIGMNNLTLSNFFADSLHPNDLGHNLIFNIMRKLLNV